MPTLTEILLAKLVQPVRFTTTRLTAAAAGDYAAGDVMSQNVTDTLGTCLILPNFVVNPGDTGTVTAIRARCSEDAVLVTLRLFCFNAMPLPLEIEMDDNIAFNFKTAEGQNKFVGSILLNPFVDRGTSTSTSDNPNLFEPMKCASGSTTLFVLPALETAEANETAGMTIDFDFYVI